MRAFLVIEPYPVPNHPTRMLQCLKLLPMDTLLLDCSNDPLHQTVLLRAMRRDEFLLQAIAFHQFGVAATCKYQPVVASQKERGCYTAQGAITVDQGFAPVPTPPLWPWPIAIDASPTVRGCNSQSPPPNSPSHLAPSRHDTDQSPSAHQVTWLPRAWLVLWA